MIFLLGNIKSKTPALEKDKVNRFTKPCPLCGSKLVKNELVKTIVYKKGEDRLVEMMGCPHCFPANPLIKRRCPVCKTILLPEGYVIGRMFEKRSGKHLHVLGCTACYTRKY